MLLGFAVKKGFYFLKSKLIFVIACLLLLTSCEDRDKSYNEKVPEESAVSDVQAGNDESVSGTVSETTEPIVTELFVRPDSYSLYDINCIYQEPQLPTGCEITSLTMLLNYFGFDVSKTEMASDFLTKDYKGDVGFDKAFIGDPTWYDGYGCFAPVIAEAGQKYLATQDTDYQAVDISGKSLDELYDYIAHDVPVVTWCSMDLIDVYKHFCFYDAEGNEVYWYDNEHCVLLCGYDTESNTVTVADPLNGIVKYNAGRFEEIYDELERQAVILEKK